uniref:Fe2OG dioxygenase domain-containing protein n=1 Tax=Rhabditophanes sp. KR3021 TaxID=114890 RepID=A0AC35TWB0_9BILA
MDAKDYIVAKAPARVCYIPDFITEEEEEYLMHVVNSAPTPKWDYLCNRRLQVYGGILKKNVLIPDEGIPKEWEPFLDRIMGVKNAFDPSKRPNHLLVNEYKPGQGIMPHGDGDAYYPMVGTISLGSHTFLDFYEVEKNEVFEARRLVGSLYLDRRSLLLLSEEMYHNHLHGIKECTSDDIGSIHVLNASNLPLEGKVELDRSTRTSLTFRHIEKVSKLNLLSLGASGEKPFKAQDDLFAQGELALDVPSSFTEADLLQEFIQTTDVDPSKVKEIPIVSNTTPRSDKVHRVTGMALPPSIIPEQPGIIDISNEERRSLIGNGNEIDKNFIMVDEEDKSGDLPLMPDNGPIPPPLTFLPLIPRASRLIVKDKNAIQTIRSPHVVRNYTLPSRLKVSVPPAIEHNRVDVVHDCKPPPICKPGCGISINSKGCQACSCFWIPKRCQSQGDCRGPEYVCEFKKCLCAPDFEQDMENSGVCKTKEGEDEGVESMTDTQDSTTPNYNFIQSTTSKDMAVDTATNAPYIMSTTTYKDQGVMAPNPKSLPNYGDEPFGVNEHHLTEIQYTTEKIGLDVEGVNVGGGYESSGLDAQRVGYGRNLGVKAGKAVTQHLVSTTLQSVLTTDEGSWTKIPEISFSSSSKDEFVVELSTKSQFLPPTTQEPKSLGVEASTLSYSLPSTTEEPKSLGVEASTLSYNLPSTTAKSVSRYDQGVEMAKVVSANKYSSRVLASTTSQPPSSLGVEDSSYTMPIGADLGVERTTASYTPKQSTPSPSLGVNQLQFNPYNRRHKRTFQHINRLSFPTHLLPLTDYCSDWNQCPVGYNCIKGICEVIGEAGQVLNVEAIKRDGDSGKGSVEEWNYGEMESDKFVYEDIVRNLEVPESRAVTTSTAKVIRLSSTETTVPPISYSRTTLSLPESSTMKAILFKRKESTRKARTDNEMITKKIYIMKEFESDELTTKRPKALDEQIYTRSYRPPINDNSHSIPASNLTNDPKRIVFNFSNRHNKPIQIESKDNSTQITSECNKNEECGSKTICCVKRFCFTNGPCQSGNVAKFCLPSCDLTKRIVVGDRKAVVDIVYD